MDILPSQVIRMGQLGLDEILDSQTIWTCAACLTCVARCPKGIDLSRIMEAMRIIKMEKVGNRLDADAISPELASVVPQLAIIGGFRKFTT
jgi:heterodisulfide reductase subunit C